MGNFCSVCSLPTAEHQSLCPECMEKEMSDYQKVREYLRKHPLANAMQIANETGISISKITQFVRNGALTMVGQDQSRRS